jgi:repressor LexA
MTFRVSPELVTGKRRALILQVQGSGWEREFLLDSDMVIIEEDREIDSGEPVAAVLDNGVVTLCKYFREATRLRLEALYDQDAMPIYAGRVKIIGRIMGVIRKTANLQIVADT